ncbi:probable metabotropic glutamate receptor mgl-1 isoform X2 [Bemisia tabaci]|uniref:probable metabotropic glutamate receptor mgl-1 isoform X2 n=1 Tax=Bemisia tabaci TaxID=7038 RepID=UPI001948C6EA
MGEVVGNFSRLELSTEYFMVPTTTTAVPTFPSVYRSPAPAHPTLLRQDVWVPPLLILSSLNMLLIALFEVFVLCKTWQTIPSRRHLFLGQMLLLGLFLCSCIAAVLTAQPSIFTCALVRIGTGLGYSLVFSTLLVKCVFLISLNGGVYLPAPYQALLLFFAVLIQIAIGAQWIINAPPKVIQSEYGYETCHTPYHHLLLSLIYVVFLIVVVAVLSVKSRAIRDNYREAMFIAVAVFCIIPVWMSWTISGLFTIEKNRDACISFGLSASSTLIFLIMFMPKGRQLAAMGRDGMYLEDRDDKFSSLSGAASPSFFHFKPVKTNFIPNKGHSINTFGAKNPLFYDGSGVIDASVYTSVEPTLSSNPNVFFHRTGIHPGMMY